MITYSASQEVIDRLADHSAHRWDMMDRPESGCLRHLIRRLGITIRSVVMVDASFPIMEISGVDEKGQITGLITVSQYQTDVGQDYVIAHALGHMVLHHVLQGVTAPMTCICAQESEQVESQAQRFARGLLIPHSALQTIIERQRISDRQTLIHEIMKAFHVSMTVASQRTIDIGWATRMLPAMPSPHHDATRIMNPTEWRADPHGTASLA